MMRWAVAICAMLVMALVIWQGTSGQYAVRVGTALYVAERPKGLTRKVWRLRVGNGPAQVIGERLVSRWTWNNRIGTGFHLSDSPLRDGADEAPIAVINNRIVGGNHLLSSRPTVGNYAWSLSVDGRRVEGDGGWRFADLAISERYIVSDERSRPLADIENSYRFDGANLMGFRYALTPRDGASVNWFGGVQMIYAAPGTSALLVLADTGRVVALPPEEATILLPAGDRPDTTFLIERRDGNAGSVVRIEYDRLASPQKHVALVSRAGKIYPRAFDGEAAGSEMARGQPLVVSGRFGTLPIH